MAITFRTDGHIPPHPDVPDATYRALVDRRLAADRAYTKALARGALRQDALRDKYRAAVEGELGTALYRRYRKFVAREREAARALRPAPGRMVPEELERFKKARAEHAAAGLKRLVHRR